MLTLIFLALLGLDGPVQRVVEALQEPDCPRIFPMLTPEFQTAAPVATWPAFCNAIGHINAMERVADHDGAPTYRVQTPTRTWRLGLAMAGEKISGLRLEPWPTVFTSLDQALAEVGAKYHLPGVAAMLLVAGAVKEQGAWGVRKLGDKTQVTLGDVWHLGSDTKAMTATLAALLVHDGKLTWQTPIGTVLSDWPDLHPDFARVTVGQLLSHRGGMPAAIAKPIWDPLWHADKPSLARKEAVHALLRSAPGKVGDYVYANAGYMTVGVVLEKLTGETWEDLMQKRLFAPLGMRSCGFGAPATPGKTDQPWAHRAEGATFVAVEPGPRSDNPAALGPAGTVHCSLADWAKFVTEHARGERGEETILPLLPSEFQVLHTAPAGGDYAFGWGVEHPKWATGPVLRHDGSNTMFYARVVVAPSANLVLLIATNAAGPDVTAAVGEITQYLVGRASR